MNISGAHVILYSTDADADRAFLRDVFGWSHVDVGGGWLIFALPPAEVAVHPTDIGGKHELYLMCDDIQEVVARMQELEVPVGEIDDQPWGAVVGITLPGGSDLGVYQPRHPLPPRDSADAS